MSLSLQGSGVTTRSANAVYLQFIPSPPLPPPPNLHTCAHKLQWFIDIQSWRFAYRGN